MKNRIGEKSIAKCGTEMIIIEYNNSNDILIEFQDEFHYRTRCQYHNFKEGLVKNYYARNTYGVGYLGTKNGKKVSMKNNGKTTREYTLWTNMLRRCYYIDDECYKNCEVCERWHCYANFLEDLPLIEGYELWINNNNYELDKDFKQQGAEYKIYSIETCIFIPKNENTKMSGTNTSNKNKIKIYGINIKTGERTRDFDTIKEASEEFGVNKGAISQCVNGKTKSSCGYKWYKIDDEN